MLSYPDWATDSLGLSGLREEERLAYAKNGFLTFENLWSEEELDLLRQETERVTESPSPGHIYESDKTVRAVLGVHQVSPLFARMAQLERLVRPSMELLESSMLYIHQTKINHKRALAGDRWDWHQDLYYWNRMDGLPSTGAISVGIFLDDVSMESGPLMLIPGSHRQGLVELPLHDTYEEANWESNFSSSLTFKLEPRKLSELMAEDPITFVTGRAGLTVFFHDSIFHGSNTNMSPNDRRALYYTYNRMDNQPLPVATPRPEFAASRFFQPVTDLLKDLY